MPVYWAEIDCLCCQGNEARRMSGGVTEVVTIMIAYSNIVLNSVIYLLRYDVVKSSLIKWARETAAKLRNQPLPPTG